MGLSSAVYSEGSYALTFNNDNCHLVEASQELNQVIKEIAHNKNFNIYCGDTVCLDAFDPYLPNIEQYINRLPKNLDIYAGEMEAFALFYNAHFFHKKASCLMTVVDSKFIKDIATTEQRETGLNHMIELALDSAIKI